MLIDFDYWKYAANEIFYQHKKKHLAEMYLAHVFPRISKIWEHLPEMRTLKSLRETLRNKYEKLSTEFFKKNWFFRYKGQIVLSQYC